MAEMHRPGYGRRPVIRLSIAACAVGFAITSCGQSSSIPRRSLSSPSFVTPEHIVFGTHVSHARLSGRRTSFRGDGPVAWVVRYTHRLSRSGPCFHRSYDPQTHRLKCSGAHEATLDILNNGHSILGGPQLVKSHTSWDSGALTADSLRANLVIPDPFSSSPIGGYFCHPGKYVARYYTVKGTRIAQGSFSLAKQTRRGEAQPCPCGVDVQLGQHASFHHDLKALKRLFARCHAPKR